MNSSSAISRRSPGQRCEAMQAAAKRWGITDDELKAIQETLAETKGRSTDTVEEDEG